MKLKKVGDSYEVGDKLRCLGCDIELPMARSVMGKEKPHAGAFSLCLYCGHVAIFVVDEENDTLSLREMTLEEAADIKGDRQVQNILDARSEVMAKRVH